MKGEIKMKHSIKIDKAMKKYSGFKGEYTLSRVMERIPDELIEGVTSDQLAIIMHIVAKAYTDGKNAAGAEMIDHNAVYINSIGKIIEWNEEGAEYERRIEKIPGGTREYSEKVKDGVLVPRFSE